MISLRDVSRVFGSGPLAIPAVSRIDLDIRRGDIFGVIGYSGAGKSTLVRLLNGLEKPTQGTVTVNGVDIGRASEAQLRRIRPRIGMIFQHFNLLWSRSVRRNIALPMQIAGVPRPRIAARVADLIRLVGLEGREEAWPSQLSGGQKQRVGIARALANEPEVLLCDEATSALDPETTDQILDLLSEVNRRLGLTIVLITHEMHVVRRICSHVAVMEGGRIIEAGPVSEVFSHPRHAVTRRFLRQLEHDEKESDDGHVLAVTVAKGNESALIQVVRDLQLPLTILAARDHGHALTELDLRLTGSPADADRAAQALRRAGAVLRGD